LTLFTNGLDLPDGEEGRLQAQGVRVYEGHLSQMLHEDGRLHSVRMASGKEVAVDAIFAHPRIHPSAGLHDIVGMRILEAPLGPYLSVNDDFETSVRGIFAAGDLAGPRHMINGAIYGGTIAGVGIHRSLLGLT